MFKYSYNIYIYVFIHTNMHAYIYIDTHKHAYLYINAHTHTYIYIHLYNPHLLDQIVALLLRCWVNSYVEQTLVLKPIYIYTYIYTCIRTYV